jgi:hypothetical protein
VNRRWHSSQVLYALLLGTTFLGYPLLSSLSLALDVYSRVASVAYRGVVAVSAVACILIVLKRVPLAEWTCSGMLAFLVLWALLIGRFAWDASIVAIPMNLPWRDTGLWMLGVTFLPAIALFWLPATSALDDAKNFIVLVGLVSGVLVVIGVLRLLTSEGPAAVYFRLGTDTLNPISVGHFGVTTTIAALFSRPTTDSSHFSRILQSRVIRAVAGVLGIALVIAAASKGPMIALVAVTVVWQASRNARAGGTRELGAAILKVLGVVMAMVVAAAVLQAVTGVQVYIRFTNISFDPSTTDRIGMMTRALSQFENLPWLGSSFVESKAHSYPHNLFVETLMAVGLVGMAALLTTLAFGCHAAYRVLNTRYRWLALIYVQYFVGAMVSGSVFLDAEFWGIYAAVVAASRTFVQVDGSGTQVAPVF